MLINPEYRKQRRRRGSAMSMAIVVSVVLSGLVAALAWVAGAQVQVTGELAKSDQAFYAAESGAQRVAYLCRRRELGREENRPPLTGTINGFTYTVDWPQNMTGAATLTSIATNGNVSYTLAMTLTANSNSVPSIATGKDFDNKNIVINGDVATGGNYSNGGSGELNGDLYYYSAATGLSDVWGVIYPNQAFTSISKAQLDSKLIPSHGSYSTGPNGSGKTYDFRTATNRVIYVDGDVTDPEFPDAGGSGTLYVKGKIRFTKPNVKAGTSEVVNGVEKAKNAVNIVATENIEFDKKIDKWVGSIYSLKDLKRFQIDVLGILYVGGTIEKDNSGKSKITVGDVPFFDPRANSGVVTTTLTTGSFKGPLP